MDDSSDFSYQKWYYDIVVITLDFHSSSPSSILGSAAREG